MIAGGEQAAGEFEEQNVLFRKHRKRNVPLNAVTVAEDGTIIEPEYYTVTYDMMMKGADVLRRGRKVRQFAVMVGGTIRLVTSGDTVDRDTFRALVAAGAAAPLGKPAPSAPKDASGKSPSPEE